MGYNAEGIKKGGDRFEKKYRYPIVRPRLFSTLLLTKYQKFEEKN